MKRYKQFTRDDLLALLRDSGYTIQELHEETGISITTLYDYKKGTRPITDRASAILSKIADIDLFRRYGVVEDRPVDVMEVINSYKALERESRRLKSEIR